MRISLDPLLQRGRVFGDTDMDGQTLARQWGLVKVARGVLGFVVNRLLWTWRLC